MLNLVKSFYNYKHSHGERMFSASTHVKVVDVLARRNGWDYHAREHFNWCAAYPCRFDRV